MSTELHEAIQAIKSGDKRKGKHLLVKALERDPRNEVAWLWLSTVVTLVEHRRYCLQRVLRIDPNNQNAKIGLARLQNNQTSHRPTVDKPLLVGLLVDVSFSMTSSIENRTGRTLNRLESVLASLDDLVSEAKELTREGSSEKIAPLLKVFAYGFGFGGLWSEFFGSEGEQVRDLLRLPGEISSTVTIDKLANNWQHYRSHFERMTEEMFGKTPMGEALQIT
jgi:hypothetical protein